MYDIDHSGDIDEAELIAGLTSAGVDWWMSLLEILLSYIFNLSDMLI